MAAQALVLGACAADSPPAATASILVETRSASDRYGTVTITGLATRVLERTREEEAWHAIARVAVDGGDSLPPIVGRYVVVGDTLRFVPRFRPSPGLQIVVRVDSLGPTGTDSLVRRFTFDTSVAAATTRVVGVHPSAPEIPANQLRWYIEFSAPMREDEASRYLALVDERGHVVPDAFLRVEQELWDAETRRLTVFFDPGRVKRGIGPHEVAGRPLEAGRTYALRIDSAWRDAAGAPLARPFTHTFRATAPDYQRPDPRAWRITPPRARSRDTLRIEFGEVLDHALAARLIAIALASGERVRGETSLSDDDRAWQFAPSEPWGDGEHRLVVSPDLEDLAGNSVVRVFETDARSDTTTIPDPPVCRFVPLARTTEVVQPARCAWSTERSPATRPSR